MSKKNKEVKKPTCPQCGEELVKKTSPGWGVEAKMICPKGCK